MSTKHKAGFYEKFVKRFFDIIISFTALVILSPVLLIVALLVKIKLGSPVIFHQQRPGYHEKIFGLCKFRTMTDERDENGELLPDAVRLTKFGKALRATSLDELPELWNVLIGDMSFVGPRPDVPGYADLLKGRDRDILKLRPGITGPASLKYRNEEQILAQVEDPVKYNDEVIFPDKVRINLYYLENQSLWMDIKLIVCTILGRKLIYNEELI